jgi:multicomponent Na+:H+ antiporter subunit B
MIDTLINIGLFAMLVTTAIAIVFMNHLFAVVMLSGVFSLLSALLFVTLDAVDVAFTEAAVGAGISTVLMLGTIALTARSERKIARPQLVPLAVVAVTGATLIYGTLDMPNFGDPLAPSQLHVAPDYLERTPVEINVPNVVTAVLAAYRGYDTMGETAVVFTAGIGVLLLISGLSLRGRREEDEAEEDEEPGGSA